MWEAPEDWEESKWHSFSRRARRSICIAWEGDEANPLRDLQIILETISQHTKDKKVTGSSQHGFTKRERCLTNLTAFHEEVTGSVIEGRAADVVYPDFRKAFNTVSRNILVNKLYGLGKWPAMRVEDYLNCWAQRLGLVVQSAAGDLTRTSYRSAK